MDLKRGSMEKAAHVCEDALRLLGTPTPSHPLTRAIALAWEVAVKAVHTFLPRWYVSRHSRQPSKAALLRIHLLRGRVLGWPNADTQIRDAEALLHELAISTTAAGHAAPPHGPFAERSVRSRAQNGVEAR